MYVIFNSSWFWRQYLVLYVRYISTLILDFIRWQLPNKQVYSVQSHRYVLVLTAKSVSSRCQAFFSQFFLAITFRFPISPRRPLVLGSGACQDASPALQVLCNGLQQVTFPLSSPISVYAVSHGIFHHCGSPVPQLCLSLSLSRFIRYPISYFLIFFLFSGRLLFSPRPQRGLVSARLMALKQISPPVCHHIGFSIPHLMLSVIALLEHPFAEGEDRFGRRRCVRKRT